MFKVLPDVWCSCDDVPRQAQRRTAGVTSRLEKQAKVGKGREKDVIHEAKASTGSTGPGQVYAVKSLSYLFGI